MRRAQPGPITLPRLASPKLHAIINDIKEPAMAQILVRRIDPDAVERLRERARREGHSLEEECRRSLVAAARQG